MSVRVNLLPQESYARQVATRQRSMLVGGFLLLLLLLGLLYAWQLNRVGDARDELVAEEERTQQLDAEVAALDEFDDLRARHDEAQQTLRTTMAAEASFAAMLQDLAAVMPSDSQVDTLNLSVGDEGSDEATGQPTVGTFTATGRTLASHAPGVERMLLSLDKVSAFVDLYVTGSTLDEPDDDIASFTLEGRLGTEVLTRRYDDGLPEDLR